MIKLSKLLSLCLVVLLGATISCDDSNLRKDEAFENDRNFVSADVAVSILRRVGDESKAINKNGRANALKRKLKEVKSVTDESKKPVFHVMNYEGGGFVIFAADNRATPVLAYSDTDNFPVDPKLYPTALAEWLTYSKEYVQAIRKENKKQTIAEANRAVPCEMSVSLNVVPPDGCDGGGGTPTCQNSYETRDPLMTSTWGQGCGYNNNTPTCSGGSCGHTPTGCVATAMAQVMRYHRFPVAYNWAVMPNSVSSSTSTGSPEISGLMRDIGNNVGMDYGCDGSSADTEDEVAQTFVGDFGYASASYIDYEGTSNYDRVTQELRNGRPVVLRGGRRAGSWPIYWYTDGHAWVADGFRKSFTWSEDCSMGWGHLYFHLNWGWSGSYNGWYGFNDFTPDSYSFNYKSGAVVNIKP